MIALARLAEAADGVAPLDEATLMTLRNHPDEASVWGDVRGFGVLIDASLSLVVMPHERGVGLGRRLLLQAPDGATSAWSHGDHPAAAALAASSGWTRARELWVMRRPSGGLEGLDTTSGPGDRGGVELRGFRPGDEAEVVRVNAAAFAHHPEQGAMTLANLRERMAEPWFEPAGLILAVEGDRLLGFHWTKRHSPTLGEVYVVGIDPAAQGRGLGRVLTIAGLQHLSDVDEVLLYVDADNAPAVRLYEGLGFTRTETHVQYAKA